MNGINLTIEQGEFIAVMGTSGSGKSTLLHILGCMDRLTEGQYFFHDVEVSSLSQGKWHDFRKKHISFVFQNFALMNHYSVRENIELPLRLLGVGRKERRERVDEIAARLQITDNLDKLPIHISGGQQQRCAIARALVGNGELLLCDEPTGALDKKTSAEIMKVLSDIHKEGKTIVLVTHDPEVASYAQRIIRIEDGMIVEQ